MSQKLPSLASLRQMCYPAFACPGAREAHGTAAPSPVALQRLSLIVHRMLLNGDKSQWDRALGMPHYNATEMPAVSFETACHLVQWCKEGRFTLFDYGTPRANRCVRPEGDCCGRLSL